MQNSANKMRLRFNNTGTVWRKKNFALTSIGCLLAVYMVMLLPVYVSANDQNIHALRTAYLFYFSSLIEWPNTIGFEKNTLNICVLSEDEDDRYQLGTIDKKKSGNYVLHIKVIGRLNLPPGIFDTCHMLYVGSYREEIVGVTIPGTTLVVTEGDVGLKGSIHLYTRENKLKFEIDVSDLLAKNFKASSKLLRLSRKEEK